MDLGHIKDGKAMDTGMSKDDGWQMMFPPKDKETEKRDRDWIFRNTCIRGGKSTESIERISEENQWGEAVQRCNLEKEERFLGRRDGQLGWSYWRCQGFYCGYQSMAIHEH